MACPVHTDPPALSALAGTTAVPAVPEVPCPDLPCPDSALPRLLDPLGGWLVCGNPRCPNLAIGAPLWRELDAAVAAGAPDLCPPGWPRPQRGGFPVPWLTPVTAAAGPLWKLIHGARLVQAQTAWCCQTCGLPCEAAAAVVVDEAGRCRTSAPLHERCAVLSLAVCPDLARSGARAVAVTRTDIAAEGDTDLALGLTARWRVQQALADMADLAEHAAGAVR